ncbi:MAG: acyl-CoA dehydrogenase [Betaproteobacteria bacterium]|nr:acyl-CoA dehydrogenase [Betaproteobacteria bacterium]
MSLRTTLDFLLYEWLDVNQLQQRERFADHSQETFDAVLDTCERIAREKYAPFNRLVDTEEPRFDGDKVILPQATHDAQKAYAASGMLSAAQDYEIGGMQLPYTVEAAANTFFAMASVSMGSGLLTVGNANLLMAHGSELQKKVFALNEFSGRWSGTMCLSEPQAGSSLSDVMTRATPDGDGFQNDPLGARYRLKGNKMWISAGEHELTENIIHLVLAKIPGPDGKLIPGVKGISLFIVPKKMVNTEGQLTGVRNADIKRMLLAQKSYCEGALALELYCARLVDEQHTGSVENADEARLLLEVLTPIAKSWPSEWCLEANSLAIQIHGGYGYTRDFPVEQYWRDNRLNMIHEGTHGIQGMDLLGRKVLMEEGKGVKLLGARMMATAHKAQAFPDLADNAKALTAALHKVTQATQSAWSTGQPQEALANAVPYLQAFGHLVLAWIWLDVSASCRGENSPQQTGRQAAAHYFYRYELPKIDAWLNVVGNRDMTCANLSEEAF